MEIGTIVGIVAAVLSVAAIVITAIMYSSLGKSITRFEDLVDAS